MKIKPSAVAGKFYSSNLKELSAHMQIFKKNTKIDYEYKSRAIIVPHAGYYYSGQLASDGFSCLDKSIKNVFIIAPPHYVPVRNAALSSFDKWSTPLGDIEVNQKINEELVEKFGCEFEDFAFSEEHSAEVQVPFIQSNFSKVKIIPILAGNNRAKIREIISYYWQNPENGFVISSDLSHFLTSEEAVKIDSHSAKMIETHEIDKFDPHQACGATGVCALVDFAKGKSYSLIRVGMVNSGDITGETSRVVGYGSWFLYEGSKNEFIKNYFSSFVIDVCKKSILSVLNKKELELENIPPLFDGLGACFVTLEKGGELRGCIGSIIAHNSLIVDLVKNAQNAAFSDPRFERLKKDEFDDISINVSLLSVPEKMHFNDEADLLAQIKPFVDGIIIKDGSYQAVYLPSVWEQIPEKKIFLDSLKIKAGLLPEHFSTTFEAYRFNAEYIES